LDWKTSALKTKAGQFLIDRKTGGIESQLFVDEEQKRHCAGKIAINENRTRISSVG
jgi:hypothetical protein